MLELDVFSDAMDRSFYTDPKYRKFRSTNTLTHTEQHHLFYNISPKSAIITPTAEAELQIRHYTTLCYRH